MSRLEHVLFHQHRADVAGAGVSWTPVQESVAIDGLPQIFWADGKPWREANLWAYDRATSRGTSIRTVQAAMASLHAYACWLEDSGNAWWHFPQRKIDRCVVRYRGHLIGCRDGQLIAPSTAAQRMRVVIAFYRWLQSESLLSAEWPNRLTSTIGVRLQDQFGFDRTVGAYSANLGIRNRPIPGERLEDGLLPVSRQDRDEILAFAESHSSTELYLLLTLGFFTGMRLGTLTSLRERTLLEAIPDPAAPGMYRIAVGPRAQPPVETKFGVSGCVYIAKMHLLLLLEYLGSTRRLKRKALADDKNSDLVFLTRFGRPYRNPATGRASAVNVEMHSLRARGLCAGVVALKRFKFHQTRPTFATELARLALRLSDHSTAIGVVKEALLHRDEATTLRYIRFVEKSSIKAAAADLFSREFMGLVSAFRPSGK